MSGAILAHSALRTCLDGGLRLVRWLDNLEFKVEAFNAR